MDNVFVERLWRSLKYEYVYLNALDNMKDDKEKLNFWIEYYNYERPHSSLNDQPPNEFYEGIEPALTGSIMIMSDSTLRTLSYCPINGVHFRYGSLGPRY